MSNAYSSMAANNSASTSSASSPAQEPSLTNRPSADSSCPPRFQAIDQALQALPQEQQDALMAKIWSMLGKAMSEAYKARKQ